MISVVYNLVFAFTLASGQMQEVVIDHNFQNPYSCIMAVHYAFHEEAIPQILGMVSEQEIADVAYSCKETYRYKGVFE